MMHPELEKSHGIQKYDHFTSLEPRPTGES